MGTSYLTNEDWASQQTQSPPSFDTDTYLQNKVNQLNQTGEVNPNGGLWNTDQLNQIFSDQGFTPQSHYSQYGAGEGVSPYENWSNTTYDANKLNQVNDTGFTTRGSPDAGSWTSENLQGAFNTAGLNQLQHYEKYGRGEGISGIPLPPEIPSENITMPSMSNTNIPGYINDLAKGIPNYFDAYEGLKNLPGEIDEWTQNSINRQRATGEQVSNIFNRIGSQRAGSGIMGGTEYDNALSTMMTNLAKIFEENQGNIELNANNMKAQSISALPSQAMLPVNAMANLYGINSGDQANWANLAAQMLNSGY